MAKKPKKPPPFEVAGLVAVYIASVAALIQAIKWWQATERERVKPLPTFKVIL